MEREITRTTENGIKIHSYKNSSVHSFNISLYVKAGCMYEREGEGGITHFLEHVLYRNVNTLMGGNLYQTLDKYGVEFNASTYNEMVQFSVSGVAANFRVGADIISMLFSPLVLPRVEFLAELSRVKAEIRESDDRTSLAAFTASIVHEGTSLAKPILGTLGSVSRITLNTLEDYRRSVFSADNLFFYITGAYGEDELDYLAEKLGKIELPIARERQNAAPVSRNFGKREPKAHVKNADFTMVRFSFDMDMSRIPQGTDDLLYEILLGGNNSRFYIEMSEKRGLFYDISGSVEKYKNIGSFYFGYEIRAGSVYEAVELTLSILLDLCERALADDEFVKAGYTEGGWLLYDDARELNYTFAYDCHIMDAGFRSIEERSALYSAITSDELMRAAREIFRPENLTLTMKANKKKTDTVRIERLISDYRERYLTLCGKAENND